MRRECLMGNRRGLKVLIVITFCLRARACGVTLFLEKLAELDCLTSLVCRCDWHSQCFRIFLTSRLLYWVEKKNDDNIIDDYRYCTIDFTCTIGDLC